METACYQFPDWISPTVVEYYKEQGIKKLFKWQVDLLEQEHEKKNNLVFSAPTSAGKSIVAEILAWKVASNGKKVLFVLPYISVAREKLHQIQKCWRRVDIPVSAFIGPQATNPNLWLGAVCTIEKAASLINRAFAEDWFEDIGMIVIDELHMIFDSSRGSNIEYIMSKIKYWNSISSNPIRIIGMSATIPELERIGNWLNARVVVANFRPVELSNHIIIKNELKRIRNGKIDEQVIECFEKEDPVFILAERSFRQNCQTLIMCSSKLDTEKTAIGVAKLLRELKKVEPNLMKILENRVDGLIFTRNGLERNGCKDKDILSALAYGIAYHHAGLTLEERECIEQAFREKSVIILVATSTLASGVNLPAERVIIRAQGKGPSAITTMSYKQMIGRAGRMGLATKGESFIVVRPSDEKIVVDIVTSTSYSSTNRFARNSDISKFILEGICNGLTTQKSQILQLVSLLLFNPDDQNKCISTIIESLLRKCFICDNDGEFTPTQLGRATMASALPPDAALTIFEDLNLASREIALDTELHMLYLVTPINLSVWRETDWHHLFEIFTKLPPSHRRVAKLVGVTEKFILEQMKGMGNEKRMQVHTRFFSALALFDLICEMSIYEVSSKYRISRGSLQTLQTQSATYAAMIVAFCQRLGWMYLKALLDGFAMRLFFGIRSELSELVTIEGIDGQRARILHEKGIGCLSQLSSCDEHKLAHYLTLAVPYSSSNSNDGKGEWLFGEARMKVKEAARLLKERARTMIMMRIRELGITVKIEDTVVKEEVMDEGYASQELQENIEVKKEIDDDGVEDCTQVMTEMSIVDESSDEDEKMDVKEEENDEDVELDCLEVSLMKMEPVEKEEQLIRRLSMTFSPKRRDSRNCSIVEDSFDLPVPNSISISNVKKSRRESIIMIEEAVSRRNSLNASIAVEDKSIDLFATPPPPEKPVIKQAVKHARVPYLIDSPLSSYAASPALKHVKIDPDRFMVEDVCSSENSWKSFLKMASAAVYASISMMDNMSGIGISMTTINTYIPLIEEFDGLNKTSEYFGQFRRCVITLHNRIEFLRIFLWNTKEIYMKNISACYKLYDRFGFKIKNGKSLEYMTYLNNQIDESNTDYELYPMTLDNVDNWHFDIKKLYETVESEERRISIEAFSMKRIIDELMKKAIGQSSAESVELEMESLNIILNIFYNGIPFDSIYCKSIIKKLKCHLEKLEDDCHRLAHGKFNIESSKSVANILFCRLGLVYPESSTIASKHHLPTNKAILEQMVDQHPIVAKILEYRHVHHTVTQCLIPIEKYEKRIHCWFDMCTSTGRVMTSLPNLQNMPKKSIDGICGRRLFRSEDGYLMIGADYSQLELRVLAHLSNDPKLIAFIVEERDLFQELANEWKFPRDAVKQLCYGLIYGMGVKTLSEQTRMKIEDAEKMYRMFFEMFPKVRSYIQETKEKAFKKGYAETLLGRKRMTNLNSFGDEKAREERILVNYTIQGTASEIFKKAIVDIEKNIKNLDSKIVMIIHDEVLVEVSSNNVEIVSKIIRNSMQNSLGHLLRVPMRVTLKTGTTWADLKLY